MKIYTNQAYSFHQLGGRDNQEDARYPDRDTIDAQTTSFVVCDGVGGNEAGEVASRTVCEAIGQRLEHFNGLTDELTTDDFASILTEAYDALNEAAADNRQRAGMGTTLTFVGLHSGGALVAHIGDSRIYHIRPGTGILYRSSDHSLVNALVHTGEISPDEAEAHPKSNYITRCMGPDLDGRPRSCASALQITDIRAGDYFLLCTDGVLHEVNDEWLIELLSSDLTDEGKMRKLARQCYYSTDNNTAIMVGIREVIGSSIADVDTDEPSRNAVTKPLVISQFEPEIVEVESVSASRQPLLSRIWKAIFN